MTTRESTIETYELNTTPQKIEQAANEFAEFKQQTQTSITEIKDLQASQTDFVVKSYTEGIWTVRHWASGAAEAWGMDTVTTAIKANTGGPAVSGNLPISPPKTFNTLIFDINVSEPWAWANFHAADANYLYYRLFYADPKGKDSSTYTVRYHLLGKWKW